MSPQNEITDRRPSNYSKWHRFPTLPEWCYMDDGDWFEQRIINGKLMSVAYVETIQVKVVEDAHKDVLVWAAKKRLAKEIGTKMNIPAYIVWHNKECTDFLVLNLLEKAPKRMASEDYINFIKAL